MFKKGEIQRIDAKDLSFAEFKRSYEEAGVPVVISGLLSESDLAKWSEENLVREIGDNTIVVDTWRNGSYHTLSSDYTVTRMTAANFFEKLRHQNGDPFYYAQKKLPNKSSSSSVVADGTQRDEEAHIRDTDVDDEYHNTKYFLNEASIVERRMTPAKNSIGKAWSKLLDDPKYFDKDRHDITMAFMGYGSRFVLSLLMLVVAQS